MDNPYSRINFGELDLWASQADFMDLRDLVSDLRSSIQELIEEAEEYLREIDEQ